TVWPTGLATDTGASVATAATSSRFSPETTLGAAVRVTSTCHSVTSTDTRVEEEACVSVAPNVTVSSWDPIGRPGSATSTVPPTRVPVPRVLSRSSVTVTTPLAGAGHGAGAPTVTGSMNDSSTRTAGAVELTVVGASATSTAAVVTGEFSKSWGASL